MSSTGGAIDTMQTQQYGGVCIPQETFTQWAETDPSFEELLGTHGFDSSFDASANSFDAAGNSQNPAAYAPSPAYPYQPSPYSAYHPSPAINLLSPESVLSTPYHPCTPDPVFSMDALLSTLASPAAAYQSPYEPTIFPSTPAEPALSLLDELETELKSLQDTEPEPSTMGATQDNHDPTDKAAMNKLLRAFSSVRAKYSAQQQPLQQVQPPTELDPTPIIPSQANSTGFGTLLAPLSYDALNSAPTTSNTNDTTKAARPQPAYPTPSDTPTYAPYFASPSASPYLHTPRTDPTSPDINFLSPYSYVVSPATTLYSPSPYIVPSPAEKFANEGLVGNVPDGITGLLDLLSSPLPPLTDPTTTTTVVPSSISAPPSSQSTTTSSSSSPKTTTTTPQPKLYPCPHPTCTRTFTRRYNLKSHLPIHSGIRPYTCTHCPATFLRKHDWKRHEASLHGGEAAKRFWCEECGVGFVRSDALRRHKEVEGRLKGTSAT